MVTFAQAQERAEEWINGDVPAYQHREVRVREFGLGFVVWAEDRPTGPVSGGGRQRLVIARDSGEVTLWPGLPVGEVIRRYEEEYGVASAGVPEVSVPPPRIDSEQTSFMLSPPEWLQAAADAQGIPGGSAARGPVSAADAASGAAAGVASASAGTPSGGAAVPGVPGGGSAPGGADAFPGAPDSSVPASGVGVSGSAGAASAGAQSGGAASDGAAVPGGTPVSGTPVSGVPVSGAPAGGTPAPGAGAFPDAPGSAGSGAGAFPDAPGSTGSGGGAPGSGFPAAGGETPWAGTDVTGGDDASVPLPATVFAPPLSGSDFDDDAAPGAGSEAKTTLLPGGSQLPATAVAPALDIDIDFANASTGRAEPERPAGPPGAQPASVPPGPPGAPGAPVPPSAPHHAATMLAGPAVGGPPAPPGPPGAPAAPSAPPGPPGAPSAPVAPPGPPGAPGSLGGGLDHAATMLAGPAVGGPPAPPDPPPAPGAPGAPVAPPGPPGVPGGSLGGARGGGLDHAATMLAGPAVGGPPAPPGPPPAPGAPGAPVAPPGPPGAPGSLGGGLDHAATMLAGPAVGGPPAPPGPPGAPGAPGAPRSAGAPGAPAAPGGLGGAGLDHAPTMMAGPGQVPPPVPAPAPAPQAGAPAPAPAPAQPGVPTVGPGYQAVLRYRAPDGSEQQIIRRSAPGTPHPEWQILHELRAMNVPPQQVLELHTELESCELPGGYCARMIRETWPQVRITSVAPYGKDHAGRQAGMRHLLTHQGELHQVADGPARPAPVRAPLPQVPLQPAVPMEAIGQELLAAFGPQGVFRYDQRAVSRQGVPEIVAHTLVWAGLPLDMGPFFWAQAQPGQPVPTLAELAAQRQVQPASDAGSYLVIGSDFGKALCVQYGTAHIVAVPVEGGPGGAPVAPQFVNSSLPQFARSLAMLGHMWRLRLHLTPEQAGRWTVDFQANLAGLDSAALASPESWWSVLVEQMWDGLL
ncbi:SUKH-4 family immunity protein [Streptomyces antimicrobicus]|uniref:SUKH-4 family immunity protein n=1 Tax=Streptomyces antimicrobicus TaxID=2883108 RepID=A0ABS8B725_9ACTN|nr:SUKH-4 family immunity protein [Streptomyces antimicrobicus]MCB5180361.1 SUKH-4 family immunity protein [Streptomyces antimicrobicus]